MIRARARLIALVSAWLVLALAAGAASVRADPVAAGLDESLLASVFGDALAFMAPRILEPASIPTLTGWGLNGISALDPSLIASVDRDGVRLSNASGLLWRATPPAATDADAWGRIAAEMCEAAWVASAQVRAGGQQGLVQSFFDELFNHLDPYSRYVGPAPAATERDRREGQGGIGVRVVAAAHGLALTDISPDGPAAAAIADGDRLVSVDGTPVEGMTPGQAAALLAGDPGTDVTLRTRGKRGRERSVSLVRALTPPETVFGVVADGVLTLKVTGFARDTAEQMSALLDDALRGGRLRGIVIDLRGNRGGFLQQAVTAAALLLDHGVAVTTEGRAKQSNHVWSVEGGDITNDLPVVIVVDGRTASAAEIFAAALSDQGRAAVAGSSTFGKGLTQTILQLPDGGELFVTWSRVLAPLGWPIQGLGVLPQLCTSRGADEVDAEMRALDRGGSMLARPLAEERRARPPLPATRVLEIRAACPAAIGTDLDLDAAKALLADRAAYRSALASVAGTP